MIRLWLGRHLSADLRRALEIDQPVRALDAPGPSAETIAARMRGILRQIETETRPPARRQRPNVIERRRQQERRAVKRNGHKFNAGRRETDYDH